MEPILNKPAITYRKDYLKSVGSQPAINKHQCFESVISLAKQFMARPGEGAESWVIYCLRHMNENFFEGDSHAIRIIMANDSRWFAAPITRGFHKALTIGYIMEQKQNAFEGDPRKFNIDKFKAFLQNIINKPGFHIFNTEICALSQNLKIKYLANIEIKNFALIEWQVSYGKSHYPNTQLIRKDFFKALDSNKPLSDISGFEVTEEEEEFVSFRSIDDEEIAKTAEMTHKLKYEQLSEKANATNLVEDIHAINLFEAFNITSNMLGVVFNIRELNSNRLDVSLNAVYTSVSFGTNKVILACGSDNYDNVLLARKFLDYSGLVVIIAGADKNNPNVGFQLMNHAMLLVKLPHSIKYYEIEPKAYTFAWVSSPTTLDAKDRREVVADKKYLGLQSTFSNNCVRHVGHFSSSLIYQYLNGEDLSNIDTTIARFNQSFFTRNKEQESIMFANYLISRSDIKK